MTGFGSQPTLYWSQISIDKRNMASKVESCIAVASFVFLTSNNIEDLTDFLSSSHTGNQAPTTVKEFLLRSIGDAYWVNP
jgi:hypothetical protein